MNTCEKSQVHIGHQNLYNNSLYGSMLTLHGFRLYNTENFFSTNPKTLP